MQWKKFEIDYIYMMYNFNVVYSSVVLVDNVELYYKFNRDIFFEYYLYEVYCFFVIVYFICRSEVLFLKMYL